MLGVYIGYFVRAVVKQCAHLGTGARKIASVIGNKYLQ